MKRSEQKEARRAEILLCAMDLFIKKGYASTKISDIANSANMSTGLLFHYFDSKEDLYLELVKMGIQKTQHPASIDDIDPLAYFESFLHELFAYCEQQPWAFKMFVLMERAQQEGTPESVREVANSVDQIDFCAKIIEKGQAEGVIRDGDSHALSACFWASVQGVMEQMAMGIVSFEPEPSWLLSILAKPPSD